MFPMTITLNNATQLTTVMAALGLSSVEMPQAAAVADTKTKKASSKPEKAQAEVAQNTVSNQPEVSVAPAEVVVEKTAPEADTSPASGAADAPTYQDTASAVTKLAQAKGRDAAVAVLAKFGAVKLPDVKPEQFAEVIAACAEA